MCPLCGLSVRNLREHIGTSHWPHELCQAVVAEKKRGVPDAAIGRKYGISFKRLEQILTAAQGTNVKPFHRKVKIARWAPIDFREEAATVWSFPHRGDWATHNGSYRGNWSPYIPRNVILKFSKPGDIVLDYFVGSGTTAVEAKLLGRRCIARDINPAAVSLTKKNLDFWPPEFFGEPQKDAFFEPDVQVGDARDLRDIASESIDLICAHPPYAGIIKYSSGLAGDLSGLSVDNFLLEMRKVAKESLRVLKPGGKCAILIGDSRKAKRVVPIGFETIRVFLDAGLVLKELVIKRQDNCRATGFWYDRSIKHNFLLLAHEYLPIFEKPTTRTQKVKSQPRETSEAVGVAFRDWPSMHPKRLQTSTFWAFP